MESEDRRKHNRSGNGAHVCNKCGWLFPNPHPSAKQRRSHKRVCGTIEVKSGKSGDHESHLDESDNDSKTLKTMEKMGERALSNRSISGFGSGSNRSNRSEDDVFSDAVADFPDGVSDSDDAREPSKTRGFSEENGFAGGSETRNIDVPSQYHLSSSILDSTSNSGFSVREEEVIQKQSDLLDEKRNCSPKDEHINILENLSQEVELAGHSEEDSLTMEKFSSMSMAEPSESLDKISGDIISEALHQEGNFAKEVSIGKETGKTDCHATDEGKTITEEHKPLVFAKEVSAEKETEKTDSNATSEGKMITDEQTPLVNAEINAQCVLDESENYSHSVSSVKLVDDDYVHDNKDAEIFYAIENDSFKEAEEDFPLTNETSSISDICGTMEKNSLRVEGNEDDHNVRSVAFEKLSESTPSVPEFEDPIDDASDVQIKKLRDSEEAVKDLVSPSELRVVGESASLGGEINGAEKTHDLENCVHKASDSADVSLTEKVKENDARLEKIEVSSLKELENADDEHHEAEETHDLENCVHKDSDAADFSLAEKVKENDARLEKLEASSVKELENVGDRTSSEDWAGKVDLGLISDNDDISEITQDAANSLNVGAQGEAISSVENRFTKERASTLTDIQADSISQTDSLEANWGSISVLSTLSDAPAPTETGSQPSQESFKPEKPVQQPKPNKGKSVIFQPQSSISVDQKADKTDQNVLAHKPAEPSGKKRSEEIIAKVTNWSTGKQHMPLKSYLGESSPSAKENPPQMSQDIINAVVAAKEQVDNEARVDLSKEWNSPARYQSNIKRGKSKVKRPYWAPFICCSSVQTS